MLNSQEQPYPVSAELVAMQDVDVGMSFNSLLTIPLACSRRLNAIQLRSTASQKQKEELGYSRTCHVQRSILNARTALELPLNEHPGTEVRVSGAGLVDSHTLGNEPLELVEVLLAALVEIPQLEVLLDEVRVGAVGDVVLK